MEFKHGLIRPYDFFFCRVFNQFFTGRVGIWLNIQIRWLITTDRLFQQLSQVHPSDATGLGTHDEDFNAFSRLGVFRDYLFGDPIVVLLPPIEFR